MNQLRSTTEHLDEIGKVKMACGHTIDVRQMVYVHLQTPSGKEIGVKTSCPDCAKDMVEYKK